MKYLKSYKIFEDSEEESNTLLDEIKDTLIPLLDKKYNTECKFIDSGDGIFTIFISPNGSSRYSRVEFNFSDIKNEIEFTLNFLSDQGYNNYTCTISYEIDRYLPTLVNINKLPDDNFKIVNLNLIIRK